jgi:hypothetical protein
MTIAVERITTQSTTKMIVQSHQNIHFTYTCESDVKSLNDPSGIVDISFPCNDLNIIKELSHSICTKQHTKFSDFSIL